MAESYWKKEIVVATIPKKEGEDYVVQLVQNKSDKWMVTFREWYTDDSGEHRPGRVGGALSIDSALGLSEAFALAVVTYRSDYE